MVELPTIAPEDIRRIRRLLDDTQAEFAKRLGVDPVSVARWETGQRRCSGTYAEAVRRLDPQSKQKPNEPATISALAHLVRTLFHGSTAQAVSALLSRETLSDEDLDSLSRLIEAKKKRKKEKR